MKRCIEMLNVILCIEKTVIMMKSVMNIWNSFTVAGLQDNRRYCKS